MFSGFLSFVFPDFDDFSGFLRISENRSELTSQMFGRQLTALAGNDKMLVNLVNLVKLPNFTEKFTFLTTFRHFGTFRDSKVGFIVRPLKTANGLGSSQVQLAGPTEAGSVTLRDLVLGQKNGTKGRRVGTQARYRTSTPPRYPVPRTHHPVPVPPPRVPPPRYPPPATPSAVYSPAPSTHH